MITDFCGYDDTYAGAIAAAEEACFSEPWSEQAVRDYFAYPYNHALIALNDKKMIGYITYTVLAGEAQIANVAVLPEHRRHGVASAMLVELERLAVEQCFDRMTLEVRQSNQAALALYGASGFVEVGTRRGYYRHPTEDAVLMDKAL